MGMSEYKEAVEIIKANPQKATFYAPISEQTIKQAESIMKLRLPATFRRFVSEFGTGGFGAFEVWGIVNADEDELIGDYREELVPELFIVIGSDGMGNYYCLDCRNTVGEAPVVIFMPGCPLEEQEVERVSDDFGSYLLKSVQRQMSGP